MKRINRMAAPLAMAAAVAMGGIVVSAPAHAAIEEGNCRFDYHSDYLSYGDTGSDVQQAQCELDSVDRNIYVARDGIFGDITYTATIAFQKCAGLSVDGIIGPNTWSALDTWFDRAWACNRTS